MKDSEILELFRLRSERAVEEAAGKYGRLCATVARSILTSPEDAEECVNDAYLKTWNTIPPNSPSDLGGYMAMLTRGIALDRYRRNTRQKRSGSRAEEAIEELADVVPDSAEGRICDSAALSDLLERFLSAQPEEKRRIFLRRYWYSSPLKDIARDYGMTVSGVKMTLSRMRAALREFLESEGIFV